MLFLLNRNEKYIVFVVFQMPLMHPKTSRLTNSINPVLSCPGKRQTTTVEILSKVCPFDLLHSTQACIMSLVIADRCFIWWEYTVNKLNILPSRLFDWKAPTWWRMETSYVRSCSWKSCPINRAGTRTDIRVSSLSSQWRRSWTTFQSHRSSSHQGPDM